MAIRCLTILTFCAGLALVAGWTLAEEKAESSSGFHFPATGVYGTDYWGEVALATLPRDRWGALGLAPKRSDGEVWSTVVTLPPAGCRVLLNADAAGSMRVEIADERFQALAEFSGANAGTTETAEGFECPVKWPAGSLSSLGGKNVRFRVHFERKEGAEPRLYAVYLRGGMPE